jgi:hypothetical protein
MSFFKNFFLGDIPGGNAYPPETNSENESLEDSDLLDASQGLKDSQIDDMNNNKKIEVYSLNLEENDPKDEDTFHSDLNNLGISEISSKKSESDNETEKEELGIFRNELNKRDKKDYNQKNINNTTKKYKSEIGERNILNINEGTSNEQQQTFEKFQDNFSPYEKNNSGIKISGIKKKFSESAFILDECHEYYRKTSISPNKRFKSRNKEGKAIKTDKNIGQK